MRSARWAVVITLFYAFVLVFVLFPGLGALAIAYGDAGVLERYADILRSSTIERDLDPDLWAAYWIGVGILVLAQALLLFVAADDGTRMRRRPRQHVAVSVLAASLAVAALTSAAFWSLLTGVFGDAPLEGGELLFLGSPLVLWAVWAAVFYAYRHRLSERLERLVNWLIKGSILELLIAVPAHIVTRQREDCCAPGVTLVGIGTGFAIMLMAFGPAVIFLYQRRIEDKRRRSHQ